MSRSSGLLALGALFASLGAWQLRRAEASRATLAQFTSGAAETRWRRCRASSTTPRAFAASRSAASTSPEPQFLLDNMLHDGAAGYHVLTALRVRGLRERVLVNRGWVPAGGDRRVLPDVGVDAGRATSSGRLERLPRPGMRLGDDEDARRRRPAVVLQYPTAAELERGSASRCSTTSCCSTPPRPTATCASGARPASRPSGISRTPASGWRSRSAPFAAAIVIAFRTARRKT